MLLCSLLRVSHPSQVVLPFPRWEPKEKPVKEDEVGPQVTHVYEVKCPATGEGGCEGWRVEADSAVSAQAVEVKHAEKQVVNEARWWTRSKKNRTVAL